MTFAKFWPYYLNEHRKPLTRAFHYTATASWMVLVIAAAATAHWWLLAAIPFVAYGSAWFSHFVIEGNRPATFNYFLLSLAADHRMAFLALTGGLDAELEKHLKPTRAKVRRPARVSRRSRR